MRASVLVRGATVQMGDHCTFAGSVEIGAAGDGIVSVGNRVSVGPRCIISATGTTLRIGERTSFFSDCVISGAITIGKDCLFAKNVTILSSTHAIDGSGTIRENDAALLQNPGYRFHLPVTIGDDCWLGSNSVVLPGVTLATGTVVGANSVVTQDFPAYSVVAGVPARFIRLRSRGDAVDTVSVTSEHERKNAI
ncbi:acyltransferase [Herbaspirillum chlorophenolicum]|uniref:Acyltransferase n=1 Tax=Herbaspirillum chlorophenolicum TaxID=211589 RepID=A0ABW8ES66_9BURK